MQRYIAYFRQKLDIVAFKYLCQVYNAYLWNSYKLSTFLSLIVQNELNNHFNWHSMNIKG